ncbi:MAG: hypothetical protein COB76_06425 [Alphaproteobacteria bacterium]|nr:MAG: hypothetical protein COB76_06425 [Alphaproteobacteria bacterium]
MVSKPDCAQPLAVTMGPCVGVLLIKSRGIYELHLYYKTLKIKSQELSYIEREINFAIKRGIYWKNRTGGDHFRIRVEDPEAEEVVI